MSMNMLWALGNIDHNVQYDYVYTNLVLAPIKDG